VIINRSSWHYKAYALNYMLNNKIDTFDEYIRQMDADEDDISIHGYKRTSEWATRTSVGEPRDFCQYVRDITIWLPLKMFNTLLFYAGIAIIVGLVGTLITVTAMSATLMGVLIFLGFIAVIAALITLAIGGIKLYFKVKQIRPNPDGFVHNAYQSYKSKFCPIIEVKNDVE
jgi:hypothetical protein